MTALDPKAQDFDLMFEQIQALKDGKSVDKPIYNHVTGLLDPAETIKAPKAGRPPAAVPSAAPGKLLQAALEAPFSEEAGGATVLLGAPAEQAGLPSCCRLSPSRA